MLIRTPRSIAAHKTGVGGPVLAPAGFDAAPPYSIARRASGQITHDFAPLSQAPTVDVMYYWDPVNGADANDGLSVGAPKKTFSAILTLAPVGATTIGITAILSAHANLFSTAGWLNNQPTKSVVLRNSTPYRLRFVSASGTAPTWSVNGTYPDVYEATTGAPSAVVDLTVWSQPTIIIPAGAALCVDGLWRIGDGVTPITINNAPPQVGVARKVASVAAVHSATGAAWYHDGTKLYAKAADGRSLVGSTTFRPTATGYNGRFGAQNSQKIYIENSDFIGGGTGFGVVNASSVTGQVLVANNCSFQATGSANGLSIQGRARTYLYRCGAYNNWLDGFNYHSYESDGTTSGTSPEVDEIECVAGGNGTWGDAGTSNNDTTAHDFVVVRRLNCLHLGSDDGVMVDTNNAKSWVLGCYVGAAVNQIAGNENVRALSNAQMWLDACVLPAGASQSQVNVQSTASLRFRRMTAPTNAGLGPVASY